MPKKVKKCDLEKVIRDCFEEIYSYNFQNFEKSAINIEVNSILVSITYKQGKENFFDLDIPKNRMVFDKFKEFLDIYLGNQCRSNIMNKGRVIITVDYDIVD